MEHFVSPWVFLGSFDRLMAPRWLLALVFATPLSSTLVPGKAVAQEPQKKAFAQEHRKVEVPKEIVRELVEKLVDEVRKAGDTEDHKGGAENFVAEAIDLNGHGKPGLYIHLIDRDWCSPTGNCWIWIYRKQGNRFELLLEADLVDGIELQRTSTKGYLDIMTTMHGSSTQSYLTLYKFDGKRYQRVACFDRTYKLSVDENGKPIVGGKPIIDPIPCY